MRVAKRNDFDMLSIQVIDLPVHVFKENVVMLVLIDITFFYKRIYNPLVE
jgi:hypothetical protein